MKKFVLSLFAFLFLSYCQVQAIQASQFSNDVRIAEAVNLLERSGENDVIRTLQRHAIKIKFDDLSMVSVNPCKTFAVSTYNNYGTRVIMINSIYKNAPIEQIACLIAHESCHIGYSADLEEETIATQKEAACWLRLKNNNKTYPESRLTQRLDNLANLYLASNSNNNLIEQKIASSSFYRSQLGVN